MALREAAVNDLLKSLHETTALFDQPADVMQRAYAPGKWNLRQLLVHLSDAECVLLDRLRRVAADTKPTLVAFDQDLWANHLFYNQRDLALARLQFDSARRNVIELVRTVPADYDSKTGTHTEAGTLTFADILGKIIKHNSHHLEQARAIVAGQTWAPKKS